jgi:hypothetical protein
MKSLSLDSLKEAVHLISAGKARVVSKRGKLMLEFDV